MTAGPGTNRAVWIVIVGLVLLFVVGALLVPKKSTPNVNSGTRAVIVPTGDAARTVLIAPCGTGANVTAAGAASLITTTGTVAVTVPRAPGVRILLVPRCTSATSNLPSAVFVLKPATPVPPARPGTATAIADPASAQSQLILPAGSALTTIVLAPCNSHSPTPAQVILSGTGTTAVAPSC